LASKPTVTVAASSAAGGAGYKFTVKVEVETAAGSDFYTSGGLPYSKAL